MVRAATDRLVLMDRAAVELTAEALSGTWHPSTEPDEKRREAMVALARVALYATAHAWTPTTDRQTRDAHLDGDAGWWVQQIPVVEKYDDFPGEPELAAHARLYETDTLETHHARTLAWAVLFHPVRVLLTPEVRRYRHSRERDTRESLVLTSPLQMEDRLGLLEGETPRAYFPRDNKITELDPYWVPGEW